MSNTLTVRLIDPRAQRLGAGLSAITLAIAIALDLLVLAGLVGLALAASALFGSQYFVFSRPWPRIRRTLRLEPARDLEPELGPRFAQAMGAVVVAAGVGLLVGGATLAGWLFVGAVIALQALLAATGYCLGCKLYGLHWLLPDLFDRFILRRPGGAPAP
ncbi:MAG: DUF4395 domain-containing protein [Chloroflexi bacterium]|nr:DUF4395 domain-containing protein [Chloroflexota bacterium]